MNYTYSYTICMGNAWDGLELHGVFGSSNDAIEFAERNFKGEDWLVVSIHPVKESR